MGVTGRGNKSSSSRAVVAAAAVAATREENRKREDQMGRVDANDLLSSWIQRGINQALETGARPLCARRAHIKKCVLYSLYIYLLMHEPMENSCRALGLICLCLRASTKRNVFSAAFSHRNKILAHVILSKCCLRAPRTQIFYLFMNESKFFPLLRADY
jgi:hypothetical protein